MIISTSFFHIFPQWFPLGKIKSRTFHWKNVPSRNQLIINLEISITGELHLMSGNFPAASTPQIEITVIGQIDWCCLGSCCFILNTQLSIFSKHIGDGTIHITRESTLSIGTEQTQHNPRISIPFKGLNVPIPPTPITLSAMEGVLSFIRFKCVLFTVQGERTLCDTIGKSSDDLSKVSSGGQVVQWIFKSQHNIPNLLIPIRGLQCLEIRPQTENFSGVWSTGKRYQINGLPIIGLGDNLFGQHTTLP